MADDPQPSPSTDSESSDADSFDELRDLGAEALSTPRKGHLGRFLRLSINKAIDDELLPRSAALAFVTVVSLVPLLAALSHFSAGFFAQRRPELVRLLSRLLPYTEAAVTDRLSEFLQHTERLQGFGLAAFLLTALTAFGMIEKNINDIWEVSRRRSLKRRLNSFILLLFWGPMLIGASYSVLFFLRQNPALAPLADSLPARWATFLITLLGLTMLHWQVPNTTVRFRSALIGGSVATVLIELLRYGFGIYVEQARQYSLVYGSFGLALLFMLSIQISWAVVLTGSELAYCTQNFQLMSRLRRRTAAMEGSWVGLAVMVVVVDRFRDREPIIPTELLAERLNLKGDELAQVMEPLVEAEYLQEHEFTDGYLLTCDPYRLPVRDVLGLYEAPHRGLLADLPGEASERLGALRDRLAGAREGALDDMMLAELVGFTRQDEEAEAS